MKKYLLIILLLFSGRILASEFDEAFDLSARGFEKQANKVTLYFNSAIELDLDYQQQELGLIASSMLAMEKEFEQSPVFWFVKGLHAKNMASHFKQRGNDAELSRWLDLKTKYYQRAMQLDKINQPHLSAASYAAMKPGLPPSLKQRAIEMELNLGGNGENDSYYWYLHWSNINELQKQKLFDQADAALQRMKQELEVSDQSDVFESMVKTIDTELREMKLSSTSKQKKPNKKALPAVRDHQAFTEEQAEDKYYQYLTLVGLIMLVIIVLLLLFELKRRKNK